MTAFAGLGVELKISDLYNNAKKAGDSLDKLGNKARDANGRFVKMGNSADSNFKKVANASTNFIGGVAVAGFTAATAAAGVFAAKSINAGMSFEKAMASAGAVSKATESQFASLSEAARRAGENTEHTATAAAEALTFLGMAGLNAEQSISALEPTLNLASAGSLSLGEAADIASNAMSAMGLQAGELTRVSDVLANTATSSNTDIRQLGEAMSYAASTAASAGMSIEETTAFIGALGNAGIQGSRAGTTLANAINRAAKEGKTLSQYLGEVSQEMQGLESDTEKTALATERFGQIAGKGMIAIINQGVEVVDRYAQSNLNAAGASKRLSEAMQDTLQGDLNKLNSAVEGLQISFFKLFDKDLRAAVQSVTEIIKENKDSIISFAGSVLDAFTKLIVQIYNFSGASKESLAVFSNTLAVVSGSLDIFGDNVDQTEDKLDLLGITIKTLGTAAISITSLLERLGGMLGRFAAAISFTVQGEFSQALDVMTMELKDAYNDTNKYVSMLDKIWNTSSKNAKKSTKETKDNTGALQDNAAQVSSNTQKLKALGIAVADAFKNEFSLKDNTDKATESMINQENASESLQGSIENLGNTYEQAAKQASSFTSLASTAARWNQAGGFTVRTGWGGGGSSTTSTPASTTSTPASTTQTSSISTPDYSGTLSNIQNWQLSHMSPQQQLSFWTDRLNQTIAESMGMMDLSLQDQIDLVERLMDDYDNYERSVETVSNLQKQSNNELISTYEDILSFSTSLDQLELDAKTPLDAFNSLNAQFDAVSKQISGIDVEDGLNDVEQGIINQLQSVGSELIKVSAEFGTSGGKYAESIDKVKTKTDELISKFGTNTSEGLVSSLYLNYFGANSLKTKLDGTKTSTDEFTTSLDSENLKGSIDSAKTSADAFAGVLTGSDSVASDANTAKENTDNFINALAGTSSPLSIASQNVGTVATNTEAAFSAIAENANRLKTSLEQEKSSYEAKKAQLEGIQTFSYYQQSGNMLQAVSASGTIMSSVVGSGINIASNRQTAYAEEKVGTKTQYYHNNQLVNETFFDLQGNQLSPTYQGIRTSSQTKYNVPVYDYRLYTSGQKGDLYDTRPRFQAGSWNIRSTTNASLHDGEMVIRQEDASIARAALKMAGVAEKYGQASTPQTGGNIEMLLEKILYAIMETGQQTITLDLNGLMEAQTVNARLAM